MKFAIRLSALALLVALCATATSALDTARLEHRHGAVTVSDPDPADCPFCGGNPAVHIRRMTDLQRQQMAILTALIR